MARHTIRGRVSLTMALDTPSHLQRGDLTNSFHRFHRTVTSLTRDFSRDVPLVVKSSEIREPVNSNPLDGLLGLPIRVELLNLGTVGWDDAMTADAPLNRRHTCHRRTPGAIVTKETVDLVVSGVNPVAESDRLFRSVFSPPTPKKEQASNDSEDRGDDDAKSKEPAIIPHLSSHLLKAEFTHSFLISQGRWTVPPRLFLSFKTTTQNPALFQSPKFFLRRPAVAASGLEGGSEGAESCRRARYTADAASLLRLLLFHAVNDGGLRETVAQARVSGITQMSQVALLKRLRTSGRWLAWLGAELLERTPIRHAEETGDACRDEPNHHTEKCASFGDDRRLRPLGRATSHGIVFLGRHNNFLIASSMSAKDIIPSWRTRI